LQERACTILPNLPLIAVPDFAETVRSDLARAQLSIHIIGQNYGLVPEKEERSLVALQSDLAVQRGGAGGFARIIWLPSELNPDDERQKRFLEFLKSDPAVQANAEFIEGSLDKLKTCLADSLQALQQPKAGAPAVTSSDAPARIYLICDPADLNAVAPIADYLFSAGFEPILSASEGDEAQLREDHRDNLTTCDAALIYHGSASEIWLRTKQSDLKKAAGFNRAAPMRGQAICLGAPETPAKTVFRTHEAEVVRMFGGFLPDALSGFVAKVRAPQTRKSDV
ncbi:MAG: hypothetical protein M3Y86_10335, partial [Verrucomicrobiota bacterium]|nr:hypothetical protein [Verrucomicrobiota bacterium]